MAMVGPESHAPRASVVLTVFRVYADTTGQHHECQFGGVGLTGKSSDRGKLTHIGGRILNRGLPHVPLKQSVPADGSNKFDVASTEQYVRP